MENCYRLRADEQLMTIPLSRSAHLAYLSAQEFDVLIIGGGIVGAGIARDAAMRGLHVALIEQGDFASGTSSKTSKLIHGGLRYLEHGHLRLVFESLRERSVLRTIAPMYVHPASFLLPIYQGDHRSAGTINVGLWLYDLLAAGHNIRHHRMLSARRALALESGLRIDGLRAAGLYADCQMDDARLCLANILQAVSFGAVCCNYVRLQQFVMVDGRICGGVALDLMTGCSIEIRARVVVNAAGPWADHIRQLSHAEAERRLAPTKGIHVLVPRLVREALFVQAKKDQRMLFVLPWGEYSLIGTTERAVDQSLETLSATADEVGYLLEEINRVLPGSHLTLHEVLGTFAGARPLLAFSGTSTQASREHRIELDARGLISILGGKFTTYRVMAQQTVDAVVRHGRFATDRCLTDQVNLLDTVQPVSLAHWQDVTRQMDPDAMARLLTRYGAGTFHLLRLLNQDATLVQPVCPHHEYLQAEVVYAFHRELACTITDVLARRMRIAWSSCQGLDALSSIVELAQRYTDLSVETLHEQAEQYRYFLDRSLAFRNGSSRAMPASVCPSSR